MSSSSLSCCCNFWSFCLRLRICGSFIWFLPLPATPSTVWLTNLFVMPFGFIRCLAPTGCLTGKENLSVTLAMVLGKIAVFENLELFYFTMLSIPELIRLAFWFYVFSNSTPMNFDFVEIMTTFASFGISRRFTICYPSKVNIYLWSILLDRFDMIPRFVLTLCTWLLASSIISLTALS